MKNTTVIVILMSTFTIAQSQFNEQHKINSSYIKTMAIAKSKKGDKGSNYTKIKNKKELKKLLTDGRFNSKGKGKRYIVIDIEGKINMNKRDLNALKEINIGSDTGGNEEVKQIINITGLKLDTKKSINIGVNTTGNRRGSITTVTNIKNSQLGR